MENQAPFNPDAIVQELLGRQSVRAPSKPIPGAPPMGVELPGATTHLKASFQTTPEEKISIYSKAMGIPPDRFGVINDEIVVHDPKADRYFKVVQDVDTSRGYGNAAIAASDVVASHAGGALPSAAGIVAGGMTAPSGPVSIPVAGVAAAGTEALKQMAGTAMRGENPLDLSKLHLLPIAAEGALNALGQGAGVAGHAALSRNSLGIPGWDAAAIDAATISAGKSAMRDAEKQGINLSVAQSLDIPSLHGVERRAGRGYGGDIMREASERREGQVIDAFSDATRRLSPLSGEEAVSAFREGGKAVIDDALAARRTEANAAYRKVFEANPDVSSPKIDRILSSSWARQAMKDAVEIMENRGKLAARPDPELTAQMRLLSEIGAMDKVPVGVSRGLKLETLDLVKRILGTTENQLYRAGDYTRADVYKTLRQNLTKELDRLDQTAKAGPNSFKVEGGLYKQTRERYGESSEQLEELIEGGVGFLNRNKKMDVSSVVRSMFNSANLTAEEVVRTRRAFIAANRVREWNAGVARWMESVLNDATAQNVTRTGAQSSGNVAGKIYKDVYGTQEKRNVVRAALGDPAFRPDIYGPPHSQALAKAALGPHFRGFDNLMKVIERASRGLPEGSPTATDLGRTGAPDVLGSAVRGALSAASPSTWFKGLEDAGEWVYKLRQPEAQRRLATYLTTPDGIDQLYKLRMMNPNSRRAVTAASNIMLQSGVVAGGSALYPGDNFPAPGEASGQRQ